MSQTLSFSWDWGAQDFPSPGTWVTNLSQAKPTKNSDKWVSEWVGRSSFSAARAKTCETGQRGEPITGTRSSVKGNRT